MDQQNIIPWNKVEAFAEIYHHGIESEIFKKNKGLSTQAEIEARLPPIFKMLHSTLADILREHASEDIRKEEEEKDKTKIQMVLKVLQTIQSTLIT
jgi:hypothetical protein